MTVLYRDIHEDEIDRSLFNGFVRTQDVKRCWRKVDGEWVVRDIAFIDDWNEAEYMELVDDLRRTAREGGLVMGAFEGAQLIGFCAVDGALKGSRNQYADLEALHVSRNARGQGVGRALFGWACDWARAMGAKSLYMSTHSAVETHAFYEAVGCCEASEYIDEHVRREPCDVQMERRL
jgi:GNAT superfamily N-acetyltransferase